MQNFKTEKKRANVLSYILVCYSGYLLSLKPRATAQMKTEAIYFIILHSKRFFNRIINIS